MIDKEKTREQLVKEVAELNRHIVALEKSEASRKIIEDITEHRQMEEALQCANYKLHAMVYEYCLRYQRISIFNQMSEKLQTCTSLEETYPLISQFARRLFPVGAGAMFIIDRLRNIAEAVTFWGEALAGEKTLIPKNCRALQEGKMHFPDSSRSDSCCCQLLGVPDKSSLCVPLLAHGENMGILHLQQQTSPERISDKAAYNDEPAEEINAEIQQLAVTVADYIALALANIKLRDSLKQQATRDPLTGLFNRRYMEETLSREIHRAERHETSLGIIMIDIDHFRRFNNTFGHDAGDIVLQTLGDFLQGHVREEDVACRYGGEEFIVILPGASPEITRNRAEEFRHKAQYLQVHHSGKVLGSITLSLGVAAFPDHGSTGESVLQAADKALYTAKHRGRNRVVAASFNRHEHPGHLARLSAFSH